MKNYKRFFYGQTLILQVGTCESGPKTVTVSKRTTLQYLLKTHLVHFLQQETMRVKEHIPVPYDNLFQSILR